MQSTHKGRSVLRQLCSLTVVILCLCALPLHAQTDTARIQGTVSDTTGAVVSGAKVIVTNLDSNATFIANSDNNGNFSVNALPRGNYKAEVSDAGFQGATVNFTLDVSQIQALNFKLKPGAATSEITVTDAAPLVETASSSLSTVIHDRQLTDLPLNGRNFTQLALLSPGITRGAYGNFSQGTSGNAESLRYNDTGGFSIVANGLRPQANNFILDGTDNNEALTNGINIFVPLEAAAEFRVTTGLAPAEFGRAGGAIVESSIKSGTNQIHGSAFAFYRDSIWGANPNYFNPDTKITNYHRNQFGGSLGGPILKDKLFLFGDYNGLRQLFPLGVTTSTTPTAKMRTGDFSELLGSGLTTVPQTGPNSPTRCAAFIGASGALYTGGQNDALKAGPDNGAIFDPLTCKQFPGNTIPASRLNKAAVNYLNAFPAPNHTSPNVLNNYVNTQVDNKRYNDFDVRLDFNATPRDSLFARYSYGEDNDTKTTRYVGLPSGFGSGDNNTHPRGATAGWNHIFSPTIVNEFRFGYSRPFFSYINPFESVPFSANLGILNANRSSILGGGALIGGFDGEIGYTGDGGPYEVPQHSYQYLDSLSLSHGKHTYKFGANIIRRQVDFFQGDFRSKGFFFIAGQGNDYTGYEVSELLAAFVDNYSIANPTGFYKTRTWENGFFGQDDWKLTRNLTLNLGLRYDILTFPTEQTNRQSNFDIASGKLLLAGANGNSSSLINTNHNNLAPRVGFAYDVYGNGRTSLRGGYGIFYFLDRGGVGNQLSNNPDFNGASSFTTSNGNRITFSGQAPQGDNNNQDATAALPSANFVVDRNNPTNVAVISYPKNQKTSMIQELSLGVEQQLDQNTVATITYLGTKADHLFNVINYTNKQLGTGAQFFSAQGLGVTLDTNNGTSHYNGLQTKINRRLVNGLQFIGTYTWSHAIDNSTGPFSPTGGGSTFFVTAAGPQTALNKGNSGDDQRHAFTFSALAELPFGRGKHFGGNVGTLTNYLIGGWQINPFVAIGTGTPVDLTVNSAGGVNNRPDLVGNPDFHVHKNNGVVTLYNPSAFATPAVNAAGFYFAPGTVYRNEFYGPGYNTTAISLLKAFAVTERVKADFRAQAYNIFNHPQFQGIDQNNINAAQGSNDGKVGQGLRLASERQLELGVHLTF